MTAQHFEFAGRLARVQAGQGSFKSTLYVGPEEAYTVTFGRRGQRKNGALRNLFGNAAYPAIMIIAFSVGIAANIGARMISFVSRTAAPTANTIDYLMVMDFVLAMMLSSIIGVVFRIGIREHLGLRIAGILVGMAGLHNLVHQYPATFEVIFTPAWVGGIINSTEPYSLLIRGATIAF